MTDPTPNREARQTITDALLDSQYLAGVGAGWNAAHADDPEAAFAALRKSREGHLAGYAEAKAALTRNSTDQGKPEGVASVGHCNCGLPKYGAGDHHPMCLFAPRPTPSTTHTGEGEARLREAAQFLSDRLDNLEWIDGAFDDTARDYFGHVDPAHDRLKAILSTPDTGGEAA